MNKRDKHAYLIEAHCNKEQLKILLDCLDYEKNDIYLHIDLRSKELKDIEKEVNLSKSSLYMVKSVKVRWGGYSQIQAELNLLEAAYQKGEYCRYHLISGVDLPIKTQKEIHDFFDKDNKEYVQFDYKDNQEEIIKRMGKYHFLRDHINRNNHILNTIEKINLIIQNIFKINRCKKIKMKLKKGGNWFSITSDAVKYILENKEWIAKHFKNTKCCDEVFLQTLIYNSDFKKNLFYDSYENRNTSLRYIDWKRGNPYIFRIDDFDNLISSHYMFARKFDENIDNNIIIKIHDYLKEKEK